jgi:hypothetical protein
MLQELVWRAEGQVPTVHEYLKQAAAVSTLYWPLAIISFAGMFPSDDEIFTWARSYPKIIESASILCRLMDDVAGHEVTTHNQEHAYHTDTHKRTHTHTHTIHMLILYIPSSRLKCVYILTE